MKNRIAVYAGSFDPFTHGHTQIAREAAQMFDQLYVVIAANAGKNHLFSSSERQYLASQSLANIDNCTVVELGNYFLADFASQLGAQWSIRGLRDATDWEYEKRMIEFNLQQAGIQTVMLPAASQYTALSSSFVRGLVGIQGWHEAIQRYIAPTVYQALLTKRLAQLWQQWWKATDLPDAAGQQLLHQLTEYYQTPQRHHHDLSHPVKMLEELADVVHIAEQPLAICFAILGHDIVQDLGSPANEVQSGHITQQLLLDAGVNPELAQRTDQLIQATINHQADQDIDGQLLCDLDMAILGQEWLVYRQYANNIRREYSTVTDPDYRKGRLAVLESFLEQSTIFHIPTFQERYQRQAERNIRGEIRLLAK